MSGNPATREGGADSLQSQVPEPQGGVGVGWAEWGADPIPLQAHPTPSPREFASSPLPASSTHILQRGTWCVVLSAALVRGREGLTGEVHRITERDFFKDLINKSPLMFNSKPPLPTENTGKQRSFN